MTNGFKLFFHPLLRDRKWSLWNRNDKRWNSFLSSIGVKSWPPYLDNRAGAKLRRMDISCVSDTDKWPPSRYTFTILWMGWLSKLSRAFVHTHRETQKKLEMKKNQMSKDTQNESFQSHVEHKIGTKTVYVIQQHQIVFLFKPYETEFSSMFI